MPKIANDKYFTEDDIAKYCVEKTFETIGSDWERIIEPSVGTGSFFAHLPQSTICIDLYPEENCPAIQMDFRQAKFPYISNSLVIGNPPFGRANKLSVQFVKKAMELGDYAAFIQPISQLGQNRTMKDTELVYSEDLGKIFFVDRKIHCCFNIYHKCKDGHKQDFDIPGILECRHIFRSGKYQHSDDILNYPWDFRVGAWGSIRLLEGQEQTKNEIVFRVNDAVKPWLENELRRCDYQSLLSCVSTPNLPAWRLRKYLKERWDEDNANS